MRALEFIRDHVTFKLHYDFSYIPNENQIKNKIKISAHFRQVFDIELKGKKVTSQAELKILQLKLWLEPAWLGLITIR